MRLLLLLQARLRSERVATNLALGKASPIPAASRGAVGGGARGQPIRGSRTITIRLRENARGPNAVLPKPYLATLAGSARNRPRRRRPLLAVGQGRADFNALNAIQPRMIEVGAALDQPVEQGGIAVTAADPSLSGLLIEERLATSLRDQIGLVAA